MQQYCKMKRNQCDRRFAKFGRCGAADAVHVTVALRKNAATRDQQLSKAAARQLPHMKIDGMRGAKHWNIFDRKLTS
jgi:predicted nucleic acid-binding Zn ribbon protein